MRRLSIRACVLLLMWSFAAWCPRSGRGSEDRPKAVPTAAQPKADQPKVAPHAAQPEDERRPAQGPPQDEDLLSAQALTDRFLVVRARLDKPGPVPEYELGEPIVVALDIRNMTERHLFYVPDWGLTDAGGIDMASHYVVDARRYGEPVPYTLFGRRSFELMRGGNPLVLVGSPVLCFDDDAHPRPPSNSHTSQPTPANILVNVLCDMSDGGDYELVVRFRVGVMMEVNGRREPVNTFKVVSRSPPLRLKVVNRLHKLQPPPVKPPVRPN